MIKKVLLGSIICVCMLNANGIKNHFEETKINIKNDYKHTKLKESVKSSDNFYEKNSINSADFVKKETLTDLIISYEKLKNDNLLLAQRVHDLELALKSVNISILSDFERFMYEQKKLNEQCSCNKSKKGNNKKYNINNINQAKNYNKDIVKKYNINNQTKSVSPENQEKSRLSSNMNEVCKDEMIILENEKGFIETKTNLNILNKPTQKAQIVKTIDNSKDDYVRYTQKAINNNDIYLKINENEWVNAKEVKYTKEENKTKSKIDKILGGNDE
ncbi:hypothetical protein [Campylobacter sp. RM12651]|uniref:hypothetical protein n=1 Tax=Campylobacter sp. RM12651 TaxID=1660079 RepID=UPI001EFAF252|nr:hypothetical protein [Campylobacter sp. RM12651]ULO03834.1 hypothetical protein AVBRAN_1380 [Campylobacter sp. RM12651]